MNADINTPVQIDIGEGKSTAMRWDDQETGHLLTDKPKLAVSEKIDERVHDLPENWLRTRMRGWMALEESPNRAWWIGTYTSEGNWIWASQDVLGQTDRFIPMQHRINYARSVCRHVNRECAHGGAWFAGWCMGGRTFILIWKDPDGDIQLSLPCDRPFTIIQGWTLDDWAEHCEQAWQMWCERLDALELAHDQVKKLGQGQQMNEQESLRQAPPIGI